MDGNSRKITKTAGARQLIIIRRRHSRFFVWAKSGTPRTETAHSDWLLWPFVSRNPKKITSLKKIKSSAFELGFYVGLEMKVTR